MNVRTLAAIAILVAATLLALGIGSRMRGMELDGRAAEAAFDRTIYDVPGGQRDQDEKRRNEAIRDKNVFAGQCIPGAVIFGIVGFKFMMSKGRVN